MTAPISTPYSSIAAYFPSAVPEWIPPLERERILAYQAYEDIYWANPNGYKIVQRGTNDAPIYVPSGKVIVETLNRYLAKDMVVVPRAGFGTDQEQTEAMAALQDLMDRERWESKFAAAKRYGVIRGDWLFHVTADPTKPEGSRITITALDPAMWFPIYDEDNVDRIIGTDIAEQVVIGDRSYIKRLRYMKTETGAITSETLVVELEDWDSDKPKVVNAPEMSLPLQTLPPEITAIPVYHVRNFEEPQNPYGSSELRGLERLLTAVSQSISDEELVLALEGIGTYVTDAGAPVNDAGQTVPWQIGPGRVIEVPEGTSFNRVNGVNTVGPFQDHLKYLHDRLDEAAATSDVAKGVVDVSVAESGIALRLRFSPILDRAAEKDILIRDVMRQFFFDIRAWLKTYEGVNMDNVRFDVLFGDKLPVDTSAQFDRWVSLFVQNIISQGTLYVKLRELGYDIPEGEMLAIVKEQQDFQAAMSEGGDDAGVAGQEPDTGDDLAAEAAGASNEA